MTDLDRMPSGPPAPAPGSREARSAGCTCPVLDNGHGKGAYGGIKGDDGRPSYWITEGCPLHSPRAGNLEAPHAD